MSKLHLAAILSLAIASTAAAQSKDPKFEYTKEEDAKKNAELAEVEWKAAASAGLVITTGNSETETVSGGLQASRREKGNRFLLDLNGAYARSTIYVANDINGNGFIDDEVTELTQQRQTTTKQWLLRGRYDRFLTLRNSLFVSAATGANRPAGKEAIGNGQLGYSREVVRDPIHNVVAEIGYDYTYEKLDAVNNDQLSIHSARGFLGYKGKVNENTEAGGTVELLVNLNEVDLPTRTAKFAQDTRVNGTSFVSTKLWEDISFRFAFSLLYDNAPAPRPVFGIPYAPGFLPEADKVDTKTEASLIINFL